MTFNARTCRAKIIAGNLQGEENAVGIAFVAPDEATARALHEALMTQWRGGHVDLDIAPRREAKPSPEAAE